jgi:D-glycero-alpha-D-manno-heptose-7-phosphate kinase
MDSEGLPKSYCVNILRYHFRVIVSKTPLRISLAGGGSDIPSFYKVDGGSVVSFTIDKNVYIACHELYSGGIRLSYSRTEQVLSVVDVQHPLIRETLMEMNFDGSIEIGSFADIPATGTGLGSSSSFTVGLILALAAHKGEAMTPQRLAEIACEIEIERCKEPIGKQDQFAAAFGGINLIQFNPDNEVKVESIYSVERSIFLESSLLLFDLGFGRRARDILSEQSKAMDNAHTFDRVAQLREWVNPMADAIIRTDFVNLAKILHDSWQQKKKLTATISNDQIEEILKVAMRCGASAGKVVGAGGGGFLLLAVEPDRRDSFRQKFTFLRELMFHVTPHGAQIVFSDEN